MGFFFRDFLDDMVEEQEEYEQEHEQEQEQKGERYGDQRCTILAGSFSIMKSWTCTRKRSRTANGSTLECAAGLDVLVAKGKLTAAQIEPGKERLVRITKMMIGLLKSISEREYQKRHPAVNE